MAATTPIAVSDTAYYRYVVIVCALMFLLALVHVASKPGRAWASIRESEPAALAAGVHVTLYKLWAFALASFMAGVAGCLLAASSGGVNINQFPVQNSISLLAVVLMGGTFNLFGAVIAALFLRLLPALLDDWGVSPELLTILFGVGVLQVLLTAPGCNVSPLLHGGYGKFCERSKVLSAGELGIWKDKGCDQRRGSPIPAASNSNRHHIPPVQLYLQAS